MAWRARVAQPIGLTELGWLSVVVEYYDDTDPANANVSTTIPPTNILWSKAWDLPINTTTAQLQTAVVAEGQKARVWVAARDSARAAVPVGTNVPVPQMAIAFGASLGTAVGGGSSATTLAVTTTGTASAGSRVYIVTGWYTTGVTASASGGGLTWVNDGTFTNTTDANYRAAVLSADAPSGLAASTSLTVTYSSAAFARALSCFYFTGVATGASGYLDGAVVGASGTAAGWATASLTTANADDVLVGASWIDLRLTSDTAGGSFTEIVDFQDAGNGSTFTSLYRIVAATGSYAASGTWGAGAQPWTAVMAGYKAAGGGGGGSPTPEQLAALGVG